MTCIDAWIPEQWKKDQPMTNFATDEIGTDDVNDDITDSKERGEIARDEFVTRFTEENTSLNYYDLRDHETEKKTKKKHTIPDNEGQSFTDIFAMYDKKKLD